MESIRWLVDRVRERVLLAGLSEAPDHVAVIQDGNRRYARRRGGDATAGHRAGAETTERLLEWCEEFDIDELTLYAFSTENFARPPEEREALFDLIARKLREFADADRVHEAEVGIRAIGNRERLPARVRSAIDYAEDRTASYERHRLNVALAYGGRSELLRAARTVARRVEEGELDAEEVTTATVDAALAEPPTSDVDLVVRSGGERRTSNFLPWQANGNEAAVSFSGRYWPAFGRTEFLRALWAYERRAGPGHRGRGLLERAGKGVREPLASVRAAVPLVGAQSSEDTPETPDSGVEALE